jgi:hypothetical protein
MSAAFFPQIEGGKLGITTHVDGKALARSIDLLDALAASAGVVPLMAFISVHTDDFGLLEEAGLPLPEPHWFSAKDGLHTVRALNAAYRAMGAPDAGLLGDLGALEQVLIEIDGQNRRWSLGVDM